MRTEQKSNLPWQWTVFRRLPRNKLGSVETYEMVPCLTRHPNVSVRSLRDWCIRAYRRVLRSPGGMTVLGYAPSRIERLPLNVYKRNQETDQADAKSMTGLDPETVSDLLFLCSLSQRCFGVSAPTPFWAYRRAQAEAERESRPRERSMAGGSHT